MARPTCRRSRRVTPTSTGGSASRSPSRASTSVSATSIVKKNTAIRSTTASASCPPRHTDFDGRLGLKIAEPRIYIGVGYLHREENYGYPKQNGFGFGAEKLPDLNQPLSVYGSVWYYPSASGNFTFPAGAVPRSLTGTTDKFQQRFLKYQIGGTLNLGNSGLFLDAGFLGDTIRGKNISPSDASHAGCSV